MKLFSILLLTSVVILTGASPALAQHGVGHMDGLHGNMDGHGSNMKTAGHTPLNPNMVPKMLAKNTSLEARLQALLPAGTNLQTAATGFKNLGQFVAAVHVSHNLGIPFDQLKTKLTGSNPESLGRAIHGLDPNLNSKTVKADVKTAEKQAKQDLESSEQADKDDQTTTAAQTH
jgi:hypothetical protein